MSDGGGEDAILILPWRQNQGGTGKDFSRQDATPHYVTAAITRDMPTAILISLYQLTIFWRIVHPFCKMTVAYPG
jgi:hypothetical protein